MLVFKQLNYTKWMRTFHCAKLFDIQMIFFSTEMNPFSRATTGRDTKFLAKVWRVNFRVSVIFATEFLKPRINSTNTKSTLTTWPETRQYRKRGRDAGAGQLEIQFGTTLKRETTSPLVCFATRCQCLKTVFYLRHWRADRKSSEKTFKLGLALAKLLTIVLLWF